MLSQQDSGAASQMCTGHSECERQVARSVLYHCLSVSLALLSPFMPFLTEELWQRLHPFISKAGDNAKDSLCLQPYPTSSQLVGDQKVYLLLNKRQ